MARHIKDSERDPMNWSRQWKKSSNQTKQRNYVRKAPAHVRTTLVAGHLSKDLREKHKRRGMRIRQGDTVKIMRGQFKGKTGKVDRIDTKKARIHISGIGKTKKDGGKVLYPIRASNIMITDLNLNDKKRIKTK